MRGNELCLPGDALRLESEPRDDCQTGLVARGSGAANAVYADSRECEVHAGAGRFRHDPSPRRVLPQPVPELTGQMQVDTRV
jgi:hypothetical protein